MNLTEAISAVASTVEKNTEVHGLIMEVKSWLEETEATMAESVGTDNETVQLMAASSQKAQESISAAVYLSVELEALQEHLVAIQ